MADHHLAITDHPCVGLERSRGRAAFTDAEAQFRREPTALQKRIGCQRLNEARRARDSPRPHGDRPPNALEVPPIGPAEVSQPLCVKGEDAPQAED